MQKLKRGFIKLNERFQTLEQWLNTIEVKFLNRILPITDAILDEWAEISANAELHGQTLAVMDSLIAATAHQHRATLVTRNVDDFKSTHVKIINPYSAHDPSKMT